MEPKVSSIGNVQNLSDAESGSGRLLGYRPDPTIQRIEGSESTCNYDPVIARRVQITMTFVMILAAAGTVIGGILTWSDWKNDRKIVYEAVGYPGLVFLITLLGTGGNYVAFKKLYQPNHPGAAFGQTTGIMRPPKGEL